MSTCRRFASRVLPTTLEEIRDLLARLELREGSLMWESVSEGRGDTTQAKDDKGTPDTQVTCN